MLQLFPVSWLFFFFFIYLTIFFILFFPFLLFSFIEYTCVRESFTFFILFFFSPFFSLVSISFVIYLFVLQKIIICSLKMNETMWKKMFYILFVILKHNVQYTFYWFVYILRTTQFSLIFQFSYFIFFILHFFYYPHIFL